jgi:hypothetical protein
MINVARLLSVILLTRKLLLFLLLGAACASSSGSGELRGAGVTTTIGSVSHPGTDDHYHRQPHSQERFDLVLERSVFLTSFLLAPKG